MSDAALPARPARPSRTATRLRAWLTRNPVVLKELRGRMRGPRAFIVLTVYLFLMSLFVGLLYTVYVASADNVYSGSASQAVGKFVFGAVVGIELLLVCFIAPAFTAGAISGERERQTYDLLRTTLLSASQMVLGKLLSALSYILILLLAALPLQSLAFLLGGVAPEEVLIGAVVLVATAFLFSTSGVFFSAFMRRTLGSTVLTYAFALMATLGLPVLLLAVLPIGNLVFFNGTPGPLVESLLIYGFFSLVSLNPIATAVATEVILVQEHSAIYFLLPISNGFQLPILSPWMPFTLVCFVLGTLMTLAAILAVRRAER